HLSGDAVVSSSSVPGTRIDLEDDLGMDPDVGATGIEGFLKFLGMRMSFAYSHSQSEGDQVIDDVILFDGTPFLPGQRVSSELDMDHYKLMFGYDFSLHVVNAGFLVGAHMIDLDATLRSTFQDHHADQRLPVPAIGATLGVHPVHWLA